MADSAALYGLLGALGGALLGAGAAIAAPIIQNRGAERGRRRSRADAELERLIALRRTTRAAVALHRETVQELESGAPTDVEALRRSMGAVLAAVEAAADSAAVDGFHFRVSRISSYPRSSLRLLERPRRNRLRRSHPDERPIPLTQEQLGLVRLLHDTGGALCDAVLAHSHDPESPDAEQVRGLRAQVEKVERIRAELIGGLLDRMESLRGP